MINDYHLHSHFSSDSKEKIEAIIDMAVSLNMKHICLTDHMDLDYDIGEDGLDFLLDIPAYTKEVAELSFKNKSRIKLHTGIELGLQPHLSKENSEIAKSAPFDFIIGSIHVIGKKDPYYPAFWEGKSPKEVLTTYFEETLTCVKSFDDFDVLGHPDYIFRYVPKSQKCPDISQFFDIVEEILKQLIKKGKGIEINTAGFRYGMNNPNPAPEVISMYKRLGGEIITCGSDAHKALDTGSNFDAAKDILTASGFRYYTIFEGRKPQFIKL